MFIGFISYTNDQIMTKENKVDISMLDNSVLDALGVEDGYQN